MRSIAFIFIFLLLASCSKKKPQEVTEAIDIALTYLSESKCDEAVDVLEDVGRQTGDAVYLQVLASAYSCSAGYSEISLISTDIPSVTTTSEGLMKSLSILSLSDETETDSDAYVNIRTAMEILMESDGAAQPSHDARVSTYGSRKAGDMSMQVLLLTVAQLGKFLNHYGNVDATGAKGVGTTNSNTCFLDYSYANAQTVITALPSTNNCNSNTGGHPDLDLTTDEGKRRACEGLMLITNLIDILNNLDLSGSSSLSALESIATVANTFKTTAVAADPDLATLLDITSQSLCETTLGTAAEVNNMQYIYALIFESGLE